MMSSSAASATTTSRLISGLDSHTPTQLGENAHMEHGWSNNLRERICQLSFQLVRTSAPGSLGTKFSGILSEIWAKSSPDSDSGTASQPQLALNTLIRLLVQTRDIEAGKGEWRLSYELLRSLWSIGDKRAQTLVYKLIYYFVHDLPSEVVGEKTHPLGSWKDIKAIWAYFGGTNCPPPLQTFLVKLVNHQLYQDQHSGNPTLCARWIPRENASAKSAHPFKPFNHALAYDFYSNFLTTAKSVAARTAARRKAVTHYRMLLSAINKRLKTIQINQCGGDWCGIDYKNSTSVTMRKQSRAFQYKDKKGELRGDNPDRLKAAEQFADFVARAKRGEEGAVIKGKRVGLNTMVKDALNLIGLDGYYSTTDTSTSSLDIDTINLQWKDGGKAIGDLGNFVPMVDTSGSMDGDPLYAALGLGLRVAEKSKLGRRVMTFSANPDWINLDGSTEFTDMLRQVRHTKWGMNTDFTKALKMILDVIVQQRLQPEEVSNMVLAIFSDMQIDSQGNESLTESMWGHIERLYKDAGMRVHGRPYSPPHILFWNLRHTSGFPVTSNQKGATMFSGFSPVLLNAFCEKGMEFLQDVTPWSQLQTLLDNPRYDINRFPDAELMEILMTCNASGGAASGC
jgi:hypothetical protein